MSFLGVLNQRCEVTLSHPLNQHFPYCTHKEHISSHYSPSCAQIFLFDKSFLSQTHPKQSTHQPVSEWFGCTEGLSWDSACCQPMWQYTYFLINTGTGWANRTPIQTIKFFHTQEILIFLKKDYHLEACSVTAVKEKHGKHIWIVSDGTSSKHGNGVRSCQNVMEIVGAVKVLPHGRVLALAFMLDALMWQLEFPRFTPLVSVIQSWKEKAKCNRSTQRTWLITHSV